MNPFTRSLLAPLALTLALLPAARWEALAAPRPLTGPAPWTPLGLSRPLDRLLRTGTFEGTPAGFRIIALSMLADGCAARASSAPSAARACVGRAFELALRTEGRPPLEVPDALWSTHLNLILGAAHRAGPCLDSALHRQLSLLLHERSLNDPHAHAPSYGHLPYRWPADQAATLASLARYDAAHQQDLLREPLAAWRSLLRARHVDARWGLPVSEVTGRAPGASLPRGCAQSFLTRYLAEVDPPLASTWWAAYQQHFFVEYGPIAGFREWPHGYERPADVDSGPIVFGIGASASALAIGAARAIGNESLARRLEVLAQRALALGVGGAVARSSLAEAIRFQAASPRFNLADGGAQVEGESI